MPIDPSALYREGFDARCAAACGDGAKRVSGEGLQGVITQGVDPDLQLLVEDDRAQGPLQDLLPVPATGTVRVLAAARCEQLVAGDPRWTDNGPALASRPVCSRSTTRTAERHQPRSRHSSRWGRSAPRVESAPWPG